MVPLVCPCFFLFRNHIPISCRDGPEQYEDPTGELMMLPADLAFLQDPAFRKHVNAYAKDEALFFRDFASAFSKLLELGVPFGDQSTAGAAPAKKTGWW